MKKIFAFFLSAIICGVSYAQNIEIHKGTDIQSCEISEIDSIVHDGSQSFKIYHNNSFSVYELADVDFVSITGTGYYQIPADYLNGWDDGVSIFSDENDFYIVSKTDVIEESELISLCVNSFDNDDISKAVIFNFDTYGNLYNIIYYGFEFRAIVDTDNMFFVGYNAEGNCIGDFSVPYEVLEYDGVKEFSRKTSSLTRAVFWQNSKGNISVPKFREFGQKAFGLVNLYGGGLLDAISTAINLSDGKYGDIIKNYLEGKIVGIVSPQIALAIIMQQAVSGMTNHFYEKEIERYLGNARIEITSIKRTDSNHITVEGVLSNVSTIPSTYSISSNVFGQEWPNIVCWGIAESKSGQPGYFLNENCSGILEITDDKFSYNFYIKEVPGQILFFRPFLVSKAKLDEIQIIPNPFTCIRYGKRKEYLDFNVDLSNFKQIKCTKKSTGYEVQFTIDGRIPGVYNDLSGWGINIKTQNSHEKRYYAKESNEYYPPVEKSFTCDIVIDESEVINRGNEKVAEVVITPFYSRWNDIAPSFLDSKSYFITLDSEPLCPDANHPHMIDLGIGTKWACCNIGATSPSEYGGYYAWGELAEKTSYSWETYIYFKKRTNKITNIGSDIHGNSQYDVATKWGDGWHLPTKEQCEKLIDECLYEWTWYNGVWGAMFTGNGNKIFIPAGGQKVNSYLADKGGFGLYWSSTEHKTVFNNANADALLFDINGTVVDLAEKGLGFLVRPVK